MEAWFKAQAEGLHCPNCGNKLLAPSSKSKCTCGDMIRDWLRPNRGMELCTAIHAEERAIKSLSGRSARGGVIYSTTFPCFQCARQIVDSEIKKVVYVEAYPVIEAKEFLIQNGCTVEPFNGFTSRAYFRVFERVS